MVNRQDIQHRMAIGRRTQNEFLTLIYVPGFHKIQKYLILNDLQEHKDRDFLTMHKLLFFKNEKGRR